MDDFQLNQGFLKRQWVIFEEKMHDLGDKWGFCEGKTCDFWLNGGFLKTKLVVFCVNWGLCKEKTRGFLC